MKDIVEGVFVVFFSFLFFFLAKCNTYREQDWAALAVAESIKFLGYPLVMQEI